MNDFPLGAVPERSAEALACKERDNQSDKHYLIETTRPGGYEGRKDTIMEKFTIISNAKLNRLLEED